MSIEPGTVKRLAQSMHNKRESRSPSYVLVLGAGASLTSGIEGMNGLIHEILKRLTPGQVGSRNDDQIADMFYEILESSNWQDEFHQELEKVDSAWTSEESTNAFIGIRKTRCPPEKRLFNSC